MTRRTYSYYTLTGISLLLLFLVSCGSDSGTVDEGGGSGYRRAAMGGLISNEVNITSSMSGDQSQASAVFSTKDNEHLVVWTDAREMSTKGLDIYGAFVNSTGLVYNSISISNTTGNQIQPSVAYDSDTDRYLVVFTNSVDGHIYGQFINGATHGTAGMGGNFAISMLNTTVPKYIPYDAGYSYHPSYLSTRATATVGTGGTQVLSELLTLPAANPAIINIPGSYYSNVTAIPVGSLIINEGSSLASSVTVGYDNPTDTTCNATTQCGLKGSRSATINAQVNLGSGTGAKYSFSGTITNTIVDWSSSGLKVYYDLPSFGNVIARGNDAGGFTRVTAGGAQTLPKIDVSTSSVSNTTGAVTVDFTQTTTGALVGTGNGSTQTFNATLVNSPIKSGTLRIYENGSLVGADASISADLGDITGANISSGFGNSLVFYKTGAIANLTFAGSYTPGASNTVTANYSSDAPGAGIGIYVEYSTLALSNIFASTSYIDYKTGQLYIEYSPLAAPSASKNIYAGFRVVQNYERWLPTPYMYSTQESPGVVYNNISKAFNVIWLDTTNKNRHGYYAISGTSACQNDFSDAIVPFNQLDSSGDSQSGFIYRYTNLADIDTKMVRYRDVTLKDYYNGDGYLANTTTAYDTLDYVNDMTYSFTNGIVNDLDGNWVVNTDLSPIDSEIVDASAYRFTDIISDISCAAALEKYDITLKITDMSGESSPAMSFNPITGNPIMAWSSSDVPVSANLTWERSKPTIWDPWSFTQAVTVTQSATDSKQKIHASRREFDTWYDRVYHVSSSTGESAPALATDIYKNRMLVAWESQGSSGKDIYGQLIDLQSFNTYGSQIPISTEQYDQSAPRVSFDTVNQRYMIIWEDARNTAVNLSNMDIFGQFVDPQGQLSGSNFPVTVNTSNQISPVVSFGDYDDSKFLVAWKDATVPGDSEIYGQFWEFSQAPQLIITYDDDADGTATPLYTQSIDFGGLGVGYSNTITFNIENYGNAPLTINSITPGPGVSFSENASLPFIMLTSKPNTINPGVRYPMQVLFHPPQVDTYYGIANTLNIVSNGGTTTIYFSGFGTGVPVQITTSSVPDGAYSTYYSTTLAGTGGTPPYVWNTVIAGSFNDSILTGMGLKLNKFTGFINGVIPTGAVSNTITVRLTDAPQSTTEKAFTININPFSISTTTLVDGQVGVLYSATLASVGTTSNPIWSDDGRLPPGLSINPSSGVISGTPTTQGTYPFTVSLTDDSLAVVTKDLQIIVASTLVIEPSQPAGTISLPNATKGQYYEQYIQATTNGTFPYSWALDSGTMPSGLSLSASSGSVIIINGIVSTTAAPSYAFVIKVTDTNNNSASRTFLMYASDLKINTTSLPDGLVGTAYANTLSASGGVPSYTWSMKGTDTLPTGLSLDANSGAISGTVLSPVIDYSFTVVARDTLGVTAEKRFTINFKNITISTTSPLTEGYQNEAYSAILNGSGGTTAGYSWTMSGTSTLPTGLSLNSSTGAISGTPTVSGTYSFTVQLSDGSQSTTKTFSLTLVPALSISTGSPLSSGTLGTAYTAAFSGTGGKGSYGWTWASASAPPGLALATTGSVSGTPTTEGTFTFDVTLTDTTTAKTAVKSFSMSIVNSSGSGTGSGTTTTTTTAPEAEAEVKTACYIATAAYGSYLDPHVDSLRAFRDQYLMTNSLGRKFVAFYYRTSPPVAGYIAERPVLRAAVRAALTPVVYSIEYPLFGFALIAGAAAGYGVRRRLRRRAK